MLAGLNIAVGNYIEAAGCTVVAYIVYVLMNVRIAIELEEEADETG